MIFDEVTAQQEAVVLQDVGQREGQRPGGGDGAGDDPARGGAGQQRADRQA
jgi:hypothetical protein